MKVDIVQLLGALAVFIPAVIGALKTYKNASDSDARLKSLEAWQAQQDAKLSAIKADQERAFKEQGQHRSKLDMSLALLEDKVRDTKHRVESIPSRSEYGYQRPPTMELTPLPPVPAMPPVATHPKLDEPEPDTDEFDVYANLDPEFKPKRKKR